MAGEIYPGAKDVAWPNSSPGGLHQEGHRANPKRFSDIFKNGYHWVRKQLPNPGAQNYAFETLALFETTPIGAAVAQRRMFKVIQPPQLYIHGQAVTTSGLGGVYAGQMALQPLYDPNTNTYGSM
jgi:hypothetical protein